MRIGELAQRTNVSTDTLRLYEKRGLIRSERKTNGYRDFDPAMVRIVQLIRTGQTLGFKLRELDSIALAISGTGLSADQTADLLREKLQQVDHRMSELTQLRALLSEILGQACPLQG
jgi:MerR family Zn(II)-responsive transcriptional regulator of zntA